MGLDFGCRVAAGVGAAGEEKGEEEGGNQGEDHQEGEDDPQGTFEGGEGGVRWSVFFGGWQGFKRRIKPIHCL